MGTIVKLGICGFALLQFVFAASPVILSGPAGPVRAGRPVTVTVSIPSAQAGDTVRFIIDGAFAGTSVLRNGQASLTLRSPGEGVHLVEAIAPGGAARLPVTVTPVRESGAFLRGATLPTSVTTGRVIVSDFNNDGKADVAIGTKVFLGKGGGSFGEGVEIPGKAEVLAAADFNRDGYADLVTGDGILRGRGDGTFEAAIALNGIPAFVVTGDFDGDGLLDLAGLTLGGELRIWPGKGDGTFAPYSVIRSSGARAVIADDFNGDGLTDLALIERDSVVLVLNDGHGGFGASAIPVPGAAELTSGDLNGDGRPDLVVTAEGAVYVVLSPGQSAQRYESAGGHPLIADVDGDGVPDVLLAGSTIGILRGNGDGTLQAWVDLTGEAMNSQPGTAAAADFDGDGRIDLALAYCCSAASIRLGAHATSGPVINGGPPPGEVGTSYNASFNVSNGTPPYVISGTGPSGLGFTQTGPSTASISGIPQSDGSFQIYLQVTDAAHKTGSSVFQVTIYRKLTITTTNLSATLGKPFSGSLTATGGAGGNFWTFGSIPPGMSTSSNGSLGGTPTKAGTFSIPVGVFDNLTAQATGTVTITVAYPPLSTSGNIPPAASVGVPYSGSFTASGGDGSYRWTSQNPPPGLSYNGNGAILTLSGTPQTAGNYTVNAFVVDGTEYAVQTAAFNIVVTGANKRQTITFNLPSAPVPVGGSVALTGSSDSGQPVSYIASGVCSIAGQTASLTGPGTCTITASQAGNSTYAAATPVSRSVTAYTSTISPASVAISNTGAKTASVTVTSNPSGLPFTLIQGPAFGYYSSSGSVTPVTLTISENPGYPAGSGSGTVSTSLGNINVTLTVAPAALKAQTITFGAVPNFGVVGTSATVTATATSKLPVTYSAPLSNVCSVNSTTGAVSFISGGDCPILANQPGDGSTWAAAPQASATVSIFPPLVAAAGALPQATVGIPYEATVSARGGFAPFRWSITSGTLPAGLSFSAGVISGTPTSSGSFPLTVGVSDQSGQSATVSITIAVSAAGVATIGASPSGLSLSSAYGGTATGGSVTLTFTTPSAGANSPTYTTTSSAAWISVPASGSMGTGTVSNGLTTYSANIGINASPGGQPIGQAFGSVTFTVNGTAVTVPVNFTVTPTALTLAPSSLAFSYTVGNPTPGAQIVVVDSLPEGIALNASAATSDGGSWLSASIGASTPGTLSVSLSAAGLSALNPGNYSGTVTVVSPSASSVALPVTLMVSAAAAAPPNTLTVTPAALNFSGSAGGSPVSATFTLSLTAASGAAPTWTASPPPHWLSLSASSGTLTAGTSSGGMTTYTAVVTAIGNPALLMAGTVTSGVVTFSAGGAQTTLPVAFSALQSASYSFTPAAMSFNYTQGSSSYPAAQSLNVNSQPAGLTFNVAATATGGNWLSVSNPSVSNASGGAFTAPGTAAVSVSSSVLASLSPGGYSGSVTVSGSGASPVTLPVVLMVTAATGSPAAPTLGVSPMSLSYSTSAATAPASQTVTLTYTTSGSAPTWSATSSAPWITIPGSGTFTGASGTYTATVTIGANPAGLAAGPQNGVVTFAVGGNTVAVAVNMTISQPALMDVQYNPFVYTWRMGDPPPAALTGNVLSTPSGVAFSVVGTTSNGGAWLKVTNVSPTPGTFSASIDPTVLSTLAPGSYVGSLNLLGTGIILPVTLAVTASNGPKINPYGVVPVYNTRPTIQPGSWISIYGDQLAPSTAVWQGDFPTSLNGVTVTVNGKPGYLWFVSPGQINVQAPDDMTQGPVTVAVTTPAGTTVSTVGLSPESPSFSLLDSRHIAAIVINADGSYSIVGPVGAFPYTTRPVSAGENLVLYGVGFGPTADQVPAGQAYASSTPTTGPVPVTIGGVPATVSFVGLVGAGLYQINVTVPAGLASRDQPVAAMVGQFPSGVGPVITIK